MPPVREYQYDKMGQPEWSEAVSVSCQAQFFNQPAEKAGADLDEAYFREFPPDARRK
jgi:hypothetical protein